MQSHQIAVGRDYAWNQYGAVSGRHATRLGGKSARRVSVIEPPASGMVTFVEVDEDAQTTETVRTDKVQRLLGTWESHEAIRAAQDANRERQIAAQRALDARAATALGEDYAEHATSIGFEVHGDGSFGTGVYSMQRSTLVEMLEAAYRNGAQSR